MYNLGEYFKLDISRAKANEENVLKGKKYRFTVLTERLIRFEYSETGEFIDNLTEFAWYRDFPKCVFSVKEDDKYLEITTKYFKVEYQKDREFIGPKTFPGAYLRVSLENADRVWYYGHPEVRNYGGSNVSLDNFEGDLKLDNGLYSADGFASIDDSKSMIFDENGTLIEKTIKTTDIYLFAYRKDFGLCLKDYFTLTSMPPMLPRYALGNWWSKNANYTTTDIQQLVEKFKKEEIPISILLLDKTWHIKNNREGAPIDSGFTFNHDLYPNPKELVNYVHSNNIVLGVNVNPYYGITSDEYNYDKAKEYLGVTDDVIEFNAKSPRWLDVYLKLFIHVIESYGVDFFWIDYKPDTKKDLTNLYLLNHYHTMDMERIRHRRPLILSRNSKTAPHRYPINYSGRTITSWNTLKNLPFYNSAAANSGITWWSHDIGGFHKGIEDKELYLRYIQFGVFSPILRFSSESGKYYRKEPWKQDYKTTEITRDYLQLRHKLIPYIYSESYKNYKSGTPLIQPIYYKIPEMYDDNKIKNQYYFGSQLLVAPIINKKEAVMNRVIHRFYLPKGTWYDFTTGKKFPGERDYVSFYKDEDYPVFAEEGAIIPLSLDKEVNSTKVPTNMEIQIFPGKNNTYFLYEDDGITTLYKDGYYLVTSIDYNYRENNYTVIIRPLEGKTGIVPEKRNYRIRFRNIKKADDVIVYINDREVKPNTYVDNTDFVVEVNDVPTIGQLTINCKGKDIEIDAVRLINEDIGEIISDIPIETTSKEKIDEIMFSDLPIKKKRIEIRKLKKEKVDDLFIRLFLRLLEYVETNTRN